jgi:hypothetical protein
MADPTQVVTQQNAISSYAQPYVEGMLGQAKTLTGQAYQPYTEQRQADFTNLQNQSFGGAQNLGVAPQLGQGTDYASQAGIGSLGVAGGLTSGDFQQNVGQYMNPYMKQVLDPQMAELRRQYGITGAQQAGQATQAGAFGGSRDAIMAAENNRNLGTAQNQAIGQAYNNAFGMAQNQYNTNVQNRLAGYGQANQAANTLGQLGQTQFGQQLGAINLQNQFGQQQQAQQQAKLSQQYQDFLNQKQDPYNKLSYMQGILTGLPLTSSIQNVYSNPSALTQLGGTALTAAAVNKSGLFGAKGGQPKDFERKNPAGLAALAIHKMG